MLLDKKVYFIKEHVGFMKLAGVYDILDPETNSEIGCAKEEPGGFIKFLRLFLSKVLLPNLVKVYDSESEEALFYIKKPVSFIKSKVSIFNNNDEFVGYFKSKVFTLGGGFYVYDHNDQVVAEIKGNWKGWNFKFLSAQGKEIGTVTKKWAGLGKELFTTADNYVISINEEEEYGPEVSMLLLAAGLAVDIIYKEHK